MCESLGKLYYKLNEADYQNEIKKRHQDYGGYKTNLMINGFLKGQKKKQSYSSINDIK